MSNPQTPTESSEKVAEPAEVTAEPIPSAKTSPRGSATSSAYTPRLYTFHLQGLNVGPDGTSTRMPPYWLLVDHTLAVVWAMSSPQHKNMPIGINQLQWALFLLSALKTRRGDHTPDVKMMIDAIEDRLLDLYAAVAKKTEQNESFRANHQKSMSASDKNKTPAKSSMKADADASGSSPDPNKEVSFSPSTDEAKTMSQQRPQMSAGKGQMSVCYDDIMKHCPVVEHRMQATKRVGSLRPRRLFDDSAECMDEESDCAEDVLKSCEPAEGGSSTTESTKEFTKDYLMSVMTDWRADQMKRLQNDMTRLLSIEEFMAKIDKDKFDPYLDAEVVKRLEQIAKEANVP